MRKVFSAFRALNTSREGLHEEEEEMKIGVWIPTCWGYRFREQLWRKVCLPRCEALNCGPNLQYKWQVVFYDEGEPDQIYHPKKGARQGSYNLAAKIKVMCGLALRHNYDWFIRCDTDTELWPERFEFGAYDWQHADYIGNHCNAPLSDPYPFHYASGMCYVLSRRMMKLVSEARLEVIGKDNRHWGEEWAEDRFVGRVAHDNNIPILLEPRIVFNQRYEVKQNGIWVNPWLAWHDFGKVVGQVKGCPHLAENEPYGVY